MNKKTTTFFPILCVLSALALNFGLITTAQAGGTAQIIGTPAVNGSPPVTVLNRANHGTYQLNISPYTIPSGPVRNAPVQNTTGECDSACAYASTNYLPMSNTLTASNKRNTGGTISNGTNPTGLTLKGVQQDLTAPEVACTTAQSEDPNTGVISPGVPGFGKKTRYVYKDAGGTQSFSAWFTYCTP